MARRPRSHQVEDISVRRFEDLLPPAWTSRQVVPDYGVDREVEIFEGDGRHTGLKFAVQLRATDSESRGDRVRLEVPLLEYLLDYEIAAMVVRYEAGSDRFYWSWAASIRSAARLSTGQKTFTHRFGEEDLWREGTPAEIAQALTARRALRRFPRSSPLPVRLSVDDSRVDRYAVERVVRSVVGSSDERFAMAREAESVEVKVKVRSGSLAVDLGLSGGVTVDVDVGDREAFTGALLYGLVVLLGRANLVQHAEASVRQILAEDRSAPTAELAARAALACDGDADAIADLAILNGLHLGETPYYPLVVLGLIRNRGSRVDDGPLTRFLRAGLETVRNEPSRAAGIHYTIANALRAEEAGRAISHYNRARRLRPAYAGSGYFLAEVGGALFNVARYRCAAEAYRRALRVESTDLLRLRLGDALLFAGEPEQALDQFAAVEVSGGVISEEALVKVELCRWLIEAYGARFPADWSGRLSEAYADEPATRLGEVNGLDPDAHFELGVSRARNGDFEEALGHFVACAVVRNRDELAWANAVICSLRLEQAELVVTLMSLAVRYAGLPAYDALREALVAQGARAELLGALDEAASAADKRSQRSGSGEITLRVLGSAETEEIKVPGHLAIG